MANIKKLVEDAVAPPEMLTGIPETLRDKGRVAGFEALRDELLANWRTMLSYIPLPALIKLVLETDRHALFSLVAEAKLSDRFDREKWDNFQEYLRGEISDPPRVEGNVLQELQEAAGGKE